MAVYNEGALPLEFIQSHAGPISFDQVTLTASQGDLVPGMVLAKVTATGNYVPYDDDANAGAPGTGVAAGILCYAAPNSASTQSVTILARMAEVKKSKLAWEASNDATEQANGLADMAPSMIVARAD